MVGITRHAITDDLGVNIGAPLPGMLQLFKDQNSRSLAYDEAIALAIKRDGWPWSVRRCASTVPSEPQILPPPSV